MAQTTSEVWDSRWTSTRRTVRPEVVDNFFDDYPVVDFFRRKGLQMTDTGGKEIQCNLESSGGTAEAFDKYDVLSKTPVDPFEAAFFKRRYYAVPVILSDTEDWENQGEAKVFDLMESLGNNAMKTIIAAIDADIHSAQSGKNMLGLQDIIADDGGGTVGGINSATSTFWANQYDANGVTFTTQTVTNIFNGIEKWNDLLDACESEGGKIKTLITTRSIARSYRICLSSQGYGEVNLASVKGLGGPRLPSFYGANVIASNNCPSLHTYFVNTDTVRLNVLKQANFKKTPFTSLQSNGQLAQLAYVVAGVQLTTNNRRRNGVHTAMTGN